MRRILAGACLSLLTLSLGCKLFNPTPDRGGDGPKLTAAPKAEELVGYLNRNAQLVSSIEAKSVNIHAKQGDEAPIDLAESLIAYQKPARPGARPNFRMQAEMFGAAEVDVGSNS